MAAVEEPETNAGPKGRHRGEGVCRANLVSLEQFSKKGSSMGKMRLKSELKSETRMVELVEG